LNFLSHYILDRDKSAEHTIGIALPDVYKHFTKEYNLHFLNSKAEDFNTQKQQDLIKGIHRHIEVDGIFHECEIFKMHTKLLEDSVFIGLESKNIKRQFFIAHILYEIILDHYICMIHPDIIDEYYDKIKSYSENTIHEIYQIIDPISEVPKLIQAQFEGFYNAQYIHYYKEERNIMVAIQKICRKIAPLDFNPAEEEVFMTNLRKYKADQWGKLGEVFEFILNINNDSISLQS
jgi:hypothetical protein